MNLSSAEHGAEVRARLAGCPGLAYVVSPFVSVGAAQEVLAPREGRPTILLSSWRVDYLKSGVSSLDLYQLCKERGWTLLVLDSLHAKYYGDFENAWIGSANLTHRGMGLISAANDELLVFVEKLPPEIRIWLHSLTVRATLVTEELYEWYRDWLRVWTKTGSNPTPPQPPRKLVNPYLVDRLPAVASPSRLWQLLNGSEPEDSSERTASEHDIALFSVVPCETEADFLSQLRRRFEQSPFTAALMDSIGAEGRRFGEVKEWVQKTCTDVPVPYRRELTTHVQALYRWLLELAPDVFEVIQPNHTEVIRRRAEAPSK